jgi:hypothetical protein
MPSLVGDEAPTTAAPTAVDPMAGYIREMELQMGGTMPPTPPPTPAPTPAPTPYRKVTVHPTCTVGQGGHTIVTYNHQTDFKCTSHLPEGQMFIPALGKDGAFHAPFTYHAPNTAAVKLIVHATAGGSVKQAILPEEAAQHCAVNPGLHLCSTAELHTAWASIERYSSCACGWVANGTDTVAMYPIKEGKVPGCGMLPNANGGIVQCGTRNYADAYCCGDVGDTRDAFDKITTKGAATCDCSKHPYAEGCREIQHDWRLQHHGHAKAKYWHHKRAVAFADKERCKISLDEVEMHNEMSWDDGRKIARVTYSPVSKRFAKGQYETPFGDAEEMCTLLKMRLCSKRDLTDALDNEQYSDCSCGWTVDGHARYPVAIGDVRNGCGNPQKPASEVVDCGLHDSFERKADTFCCSDAPMLAESNL